MTHHPELEELSAYAAGDLDAAAATSVRAHVEGCPDCQADVTALRDLGDVLASMPTVPMPDDVAARVDTAVAVARAEGASGRVPGVGTVVPMRASRRGAWRAKLATAAAGSAAAALVGVLAIGALTNSPGDANSGRGQVALDAGAEADGASSRLILDTGTDYTLDDVDAQVATLVAAKGPRASAASPLSEDTGGSAAGEYTSGGEAPTVASRAAPVEQINRCVDLLVAQLAAAPEQSPGAAPPEPQVVDLGTFEGSDAIVVVFPNGPNRYEVWFLDAQRCGTTEAGEDVGLLAQRNVTV